MNHSKRLGEEDVLKLLVSFSIPSIVGMLVNGLYNIVDRVFIGQGVGTSALSGLTVSFPIMMVSMALSMLIGLGASPLISIRLGENKKEKAELIAGNAITLFIIVSVIITILGIVFVEPILKAFGASNESFGYARDYVRIILLGTIFQSIGFGLNPIIRAEGNPKTSMYTMLIGAVINAALAPVLIFIFHMGVKGAAIATITAQMVSAIWVLAYFLGKKSQIKIHLENLKLKYKIVKSIISLGFAPFAIQILGSVLLILLNNQLAFYGGDRAIAVMGIVFSVLMIIVMPIFGINQGAQPIIGFNFGAKNYDRVKTTLKHAIIAGTCISTVGFILAQTLPAPIIALFNSKDPELIKMGVHAIRLITIMLPVVGFQIVCQNYFQATGKPVATILLTILRQLVLLIPLIYILPEYWGLNGIWLAYPFSDTGSAILTGLVIYMEIKKLGKETEIK